MATKADFARAGYKRYDASTIKDMSDVYECMYQKEVSDQEGNCKYFINAYPYHFTTGNRLVQGININLQLYRGDFTFDIDINPRNNKDATVAEIETLIEELWTKFGFDLDHHN